jgi:uncharacterized protein (TIGR00725 family)
MKVTVFGGASAQPGDPGYQDAFKLGSLLAQAGHTVLTGGYMGTMEAASKGAALAGGLVIGVTCAEIERWRNARANPWVKEEWKTDTLAERLSLLIDHAQAAIALPGGPGTLVEISLLWNRMIIAAAPVRPLIIVGKGWKDTFETLFHEQEPYIGEPQRRLLTFSPTVEEAAALLRLDG